MKLIRLLGVALLLASGCGDIDEVQVQTQSVKPTNALTTYLTIDNTIVAEVDQILVDGQDVLVQPDDKLKLFKNKTAVVTLKPPGVSCGLLFQSLLWNAISPPGLATSTNIRKDVSVIALKRDGSEARRWDVTEAFPTDWDPGEYCPASNKATETVVAKLGSVELG